MFSAHLIFGDVDRHSRIPFGERRRVLEEFWRICDEMKPPGFEENKHSFFDVDNDSIMIGLSDFEGLVSGESVLKWTLSLREKLITKEIPVTFGVNLLACGSPIHWETYRGIVESLSKEGYMYTPDKIYSMYGRVQRPRLIGDSLIVAARLLEMAKRLKYSMGFSVLRGGHTDMKKLESNLCNFSVREISNDKLDYALKDKADWMRERNVNAWGIRAR